MMAKEDELQDMFMKKAPDHFNPEALNYLWQEAVGIDGTQESKSLFLSRVSQLENSDASAWYALFAEMHARNLLVSALDSPVAFSEEDSNDLCIQDDQPYFIEVKAILPNDFQKDYENFLWELESIPSGKRVGIRVKEFKRSRRELFQKITRILANTTENFSDPEIEIKVFGDAYNKEKTEFISPPYDFFVNESELEELLIKKLKGESQFKKADAFFLYSFDKKWDQEDFFNVVQKFTQYTDKLQGVESKVFLCITSWNEPETAVFFFEDGSLRSYYLSECTELLT